MGRPTKYKKEYDEQAFKLCLLGATDNQLADFFATTEQTINAWKKAHKSFLESLKAGKAEADARVADALFNRALGFTTKETKISSDEVVNTTKQHPPDPTSCIFWLKNRQRDKWRDKPEAEDGDESTPQKVQIEVVDARTR